LKIYLKQQEKLNMFKTPEMKASDYTCLLCGSKLGLKLNSLITGDNEGACPECSEPFFINITSDEMAELKAAEKKSNRHIL
jgi:DNA-directed RNA polymerase subunit RPC12/RpoP